MTKAKKIIFSIVCALFLAIACFACFNLNKTAVFADTSNENNAITNENGSQNEGEITPRLLVTLSLTLNGGDGKIWATVKNDFQLFPSTVNVIVQLFYSYSYCEDYNQMTLAKIDSTEDLNMGTSITIETTTGGEERFWMARMRYRENSGSWQERVASARYSASGEYIGLT